MADQISISAGALTRGVHEHYQQILGRLVEQVALLEVALDQTTAERDVLKTLLDANGGPSAPDGDPEQPS